MRDFIDFTAKEKEYLEYIEEHVGNVQKVWGMVSPNISDLDSFTKAKISVLVSIHDMSKQSKEEFEPYRQYFYPEEGEKPDKKAFNIAWKHHYAYNPHHWEHWAGLVDGLVQKMPVTFLIEMLCDWGAMSMKFKNGNPRDFYEKNKHKMKLHDGTIELIEKYIDFFDEFGQKEI